MRVWIWCLVQGFKYKSLESGSLCFKDKLYYEVVSCLLVSILYHDSDSQETMSLKVILTEQLFP